MNKLFVVGIFCVLSISTFSQVCTVTGTSPLNWPGNGTGIVCAEGGNAVGKSVLRIPAGFIVNFDNNTDTWSGWFIEVFGTLNITANPVLNSTIYVKSGGLLNITGKLELGSATDPSCNYFLGVNTGGTVTVGPSGSDRLTICGERIMKGAGSGACNDCGGTNSAQCAYDGTPYCQPAGGFVGPAGYGQFGYDASLPVKLLYFRAEPQGETVSLQWATSIEEGFNKFIVQRSADGLIYDDIGEVSGKGFDIYDIETKYSFADEAPLLGLSYYRLKAVDLDDSFEYFGVKAVKFAGQKSIAVFPNPSVGDVISFRTNFGPKESDRIVLTDQLGVEIFNSQVSTIGNNIILQNKLSSGIYLLRYVSKGLELTVRILVRS